jgi:hypothetical protein
METEMHYKTHMLTDDGVVIVTDDDMVAVPSTNPLYLKLREKLNAHDLAGIDEVLDRTGKIKPHTNGEFWVDEDGCVVHSGEVMPTSLSERLLALVDKEMPWKPLVKFWELRPSANLWGFMHHTDIPLMGNGHILAYKRVRRLAEGDEEVGKPRAGAKPPVNGEHKPEDYLRAGDLVDCRTGKFRNNVGDEPKMERAAVATDPEEACGPGLHVAAWKYADQFYANGVLIEVVVDPRDIVSVPSDHDEMKVRTCGYKVLREVAEPREEPLAFSVGDEVEWERDEGPGVVRGALVRIIEVLEGHPNKYRVERVDGTGEAEVPEDQLSWPRDSEEDYEEPEGDCPVCGKYVENCTCDPEDHEVHATREEAEAACDDEDSDEDLDVLEAELDGVDELLED